MYNGQEYLIKTSIYFITTKPSNIYKMIISKIVYINIKETIEECIHKGVMPSIELANELGLEYDALTSIFSQLRVRYVKLQIRQFDNKTMKNIIKRINIGCELISDIAMEYNFSPYKLAKMYIDTFYNKTISITNIIKDPLLVESEHIRIDILTNCCMKDPMVSWDIDITKQTIGHEYEEYLINMLNSYNLCYETEEDLRNKGKAKTPDILFLIPMGIKIPKNYYLKNINRDKVKNTNIDVNVNMNANVNPKSNPNPNFTADSDVVNKKLFHDNDDNELDIGTETDIGVGLGVSHPQSLTLKEEEEEEEEYVIINWIDSKALFADESTLNDNIDQLQGYVNRYGRGLVIYWHGYVESIVDLISQRYDHSPNNNTSNSNPITNSNPSPGPAPMELIPSNVNDINNLVKRTTSNSKQSITTTTNTTTSTNLIYDNPSINATINTTAMTNVTCNTNPNHAHTHTHVTTISLKPSVNSMIYVSDSLPTEWLFPSGETI